MAEYLPCGCHHNAILGGRSPVHPHLSEAAQRRGRNNRSRGNGHELKAARLYGGEKVGPLGLPEDIRGKTFRTQVKTHQRLAPKEWRVAFAKMDGRPSSLLPRLLVRYLAGPGIPADDYFVIRGRDILDWLGRDE